MTVIRVALIAILCAGSAAAASEAGTPPKDWSTYYLPDVQNPTSPVLLVQDRHHRTSLGTRVSRFTKGLAGMSDGVERLTAQWPDGRDVLLVELTDWLWPPEATVEWFMAFIAADARDASDETIRSLATAMLAQRCGSMTAWGPDCGRIEARFDVASVDCPSHRSVRRWGRWRMRWAEELPFVYTTAHEDESLPSALWYAVYNAWPTWDGYYENPPLTPTFVALVDPRFREEVRELLLDLDRLGRESGT